MVDNVAQSVRLPLVVKRLDACAHKRRAVRVANVAERTEHELHFCAVIFGLDELIRLCRDNDDRDGAQPHSGHVAVAVKVVLGLELRQHLLGGAAVLRTHALETCVDAGVHAPEPRQRAVKDGLRAAEIGHNCDPNRRNVLWRDDNVDKRRQVSAAAELPEMYLHGLLLLLLLLRRPFCGRVLLLTCAVHCDLAASGVVLERRSTRFALLNIGDRARRDAAHELRLAAASRPQQQPVVLGGLLGGLFEVRRDVCPQVFSGIDLKLCHRRAGMKRVRCLSCGRRGGWGRWLGRHGSFFLCK
eukprot:PhM_4_TR7257/c0_g2_i1/m.95246